MAIELKIENKSDLERIEKVGRCITPGTLFQTCKRLKICDKHKLSHAFQRIYISC